MDAKHTPDDDQSTIHQEVQKYYGETLESSDDLKTSACCTVVEPEDYIKKALAEIHDEVHARYYGCGLALPEYLEGAAVLDLGCGAGRDVYLLSRLTGEQGRVVGVDMTPEQLAVAREHQDYHRERFGFANSNVEFVEGNIERLQETDLADGSFDAIVSNCVINLAVDKLGVLQNAFRLLKNGGELYFADVYADRRIPDELISDPVLYGECLSGALYWRDFVRLAREAGFAPPELVSSHAIDIEDAEVAAKTGDIRFCSATYRLFKCADAEPAAEDYGHSAKYRGELAEHPQELALSQDLVFKKGERVAISGNTVRILQESRFSQYFDIFGDFTAHFGAFNEKTVVNPFELMSAAEPASSCC